MLRVLGYRELSIFQVHAGSTTLTPQYFLLSSFDTASVGLYTQYFSGHVMGRRRWTRPGLSNFRRVGRDPARPIIFSDDRPRPGPARHIFRRWAAARPMAFAARPRRHGPARGFKGQTHVLPRTKKQLKRCTLVFLGFLLIVRKFRKTFFFLKIFPESQEKICISFGYSSQNPEPEEFLGLSFWNSASG